MTEQPMLGIKRINGHTYIKIQDLAKDWHTTTSSILATGKPQQVPARYRRTIDGCTWCDVDGLRYRLNSMKRGGKIREQLRQLVDRFPKNEKYDGMVSIFNTINHPTSEEIADASTNRTILLRKKNNHIQVLAQTLSNFLGTKTTSLLAANKKDGVPEKFIHRERKQTWVDLDGLKERVEQTDHSNGLLKCLKILIPQMEAYESDEPISKVFERLIHPSANASKRCTECEQQNNDKPKQVECCNVAVEANKRAVRNTKRFNTLYARMLDLDKRVKGVEFDIPQLLKEVSHHGDKVYDVWKRVNDIETADAAAAEAIAEHRTPLDNLASRVMDLEDKHKNLENMTRDHWKKANDKHDHLGDCVWKLEKWLGRVDKQVTQNTVNQTLLGDLNTRLGRLVSQADSLDTKTDGLRSRVSVLEDTSKWLSWTLAGVIGLRFLSLMLRGLRRK